MKLVILVQVIQCFLLHLLMVRCIVSKNEEINRRIISNRLAKENPGTNQANFGENSQQVLLPAFIAAYSGKNPDKVATGLFRDIPIPNWTLRYNGLMKLKFFKKNFQQLCGFPWVSIFVYGV